MNSSCNKRRTLNKPLRLLFVSTGSISVVLGSIGMFVPLIPTTPFLLLAAALYLRSSDKLHNWLMNHRIYGKYLTNYMVHRSIPLNVKIFTLILLWVTIITSALFFIPYLWLSILLILKAVIVTIHILSFKTLK